MARQLSRFVHRIKVPSGRELLYHALTQEYLWLADDDDNMESYVEAHKPQFLCEVKDDEKLLEIYRQELKSPYINTAYFFLTKNCNLACRYCFERQSETENTPDGVMSCETFDKALYFFERLIKSDSQQYESMRYFSLIFYGGEPFFNKKTLYHAIERVESEIKCGNLPESRVKMLVVTNGTLLTDEDIYYLKAHNITVTFSLDGDKQASVNRVYPDRKTLAWERASETFKRCKSIGLNLNIACTLTLETIKRQNEVLDYFINDIGATNLGFNVILDNDIINIGDIKTYDETAADFVVSAWEKLSSNNVRENRVARRFQVFHPTDGNISRTEYIPTIHSSCRFDCNAVGGRQIAVAPDGSVGICHEHIMDKKHFVTSIDDDQFMPSESSTYLEWASRTPLYIEKCYDCPAIGICGGGCVINSERNNGDMSLPDNRFCAQTLSIFHKILIPTLDR